MRTARTLAASALLLIAAPLWAQVGPTQTGHELDANPSATGGPINARVTQPNFSRGDYLITGEVGAGRSFQGLLPYSSLRQFQGSLGSATLYNFNRDSVSTAQARYSGVFTSDQAPLYQVSSRTVYGAGDVRPGLTGATGATGGLATPLNPFARPQYARNLPSAAVSSESAGWSSVHPLSALANSPLNLSAADPAGQLELRSEALAIEKGLWRQQLEQQLRGESITGEPTTAQPAPPANPAEPGRIEPLRPLGDQARLGPLGRPGGDDLDRLRLESRLGPIQGRPGEPAEPDDDQTGQPPAAEPVATGEDLYSDLLRRVEEIRRNQDAALQPTRPEAGPRTGPPAPTPVPTPPSPAVPAVPPTPAAPDGEAAANPTPETPAQPRPVVNLALRQDSFASRLPTEANVAIRQAEQLIGQGRFYRALDKLVAAQACDPTNPLVWLRAAHAHFAAGEYYSAALNLRRAMEIFPSVASLQTDLGKLLNNPKLLERRMTDLRDLVRVGHNGALLMLHSYLAYVTGDMAQARLSAEAIGQADGPAAQAWARFVLASAPAPTPTTQPER